MLFHLSCFLIKLCKSVLKNVELATRNEAFGDIQLYNNASVWWQLVPAHHSSTAAGHPDNDSSVLTFHIIVCTWNWLELTRFKFLPSTIPLKKHLWRIMFMLVDSLCLKCDPKSSSSSYCLEVRYGFLQNLLGYCHWPPDHELLTGCSHRRILV